MRNFEVSRIRSEALWKKPGCLRDRSVDSGPVRPCPPGYSSEPPSPLSGSILSRSILSPHQAAPSSHWIVVWNNLNCKIGWLDEEQMRWTMKVFTRWKWSRWNGEISRQTKTRKMSTCVMELETTCKRGPGQNPSSRETPPPSPVFPRISAPNGKFQQTSQPAVGRWRCCIPASQLTPQPIVLSCCS